MHTALLYSRGVIAVSGTDARSFLQGLLTVDTLKLTRGQARYALLLSPQGKFLHDLFVIDEGGRLLLDVEKPRMNDLQGRLKLYRLRAQVDIAPLEDHHVFAHWGGAQAAEAFPGVTVADPRLAALGWRRIAQETVPADASEEDYAAHRLSLGVPDGSRDLKVDKSLPLEFAVDHLHGVDFDKGCYVGQEVTARMRYRANLRKYLFRVSAEQLLPAEGTPVMSGQQNVGELRSSHKQAGLAVLSIDAVTKGQPLTAGGIALAAVLPTWAKLPESAG